MKILVIRYDDECVRLRMSDEKADFLKNFLSVELPLWNGTIKEYLEEDRIVKVHWEDTEDVIDL